MFLAAASPAYAAAGFKTYRRLLLRGNFVESSRLRCKNRLTDAA